MNLLSPIVVFNTYSKWGIYSSSGLLRLYKSTDGGSTYGTLLAEWDVVGMNYTYQVDLVDLLRVWYEPILNGANDWCMYYKLVFVSSSSSTEREVEHGVWYYGLEDSITDRYISRRFVPSYVFPVSYIGNKTVVVDGTSHSLVSPVGMCVSYNPSDSLSIGGNAFEKVDSGYQLCYINSHGGWSVFVPDGAVYRNDVRKYESGSKYSSLTGSLRRTSIQYGSKVNVQYEVNSGWLDEGQAAMLAKDLLESSYMFICTPEYPNGIPCLVEESSINYMDRHKDSVMNYTFVVKVAEEIRR